MPRDATSGPGGSPTRKKAKSKAKTKKTPTVQSNLMFRVDRNKYLGQLLLMDESIYDGKVPEQVKGKLFLYKTREYSRCGKQIIVECMGKVIDDDGGDAFSAWKEGTADDQLIASIFYTGSERNTGKTFLRARTFLTIWTTNATASILSNFG